MHGALKKAPSESQHHQHNSSNRYGHCKHKQEQQHISSKQSPMLIGPAALRLSLSSSSICGAAEKSAAKVICRHPRRSTNATIIGRNAPSGWSSAWLEHFGSSSTATSAQAAASCHSSSCLLANSDGIVGATIWHALLPSSFLSVGPQKGFAKYGYVQQQQQGRTIAIGRLSNGNSSSSSSRGTIALSSFHLSARPSLSFNDGSWNVACDARPARWLHGRDSAWLLFGFCSCFTLDNINSPPAVAAAAAAAAAATTAAAAATTATVACCEANPADITAITDSEKPLEATGEAEGTHGKTIYKDFSVIGVPGDGRCLFRAVAYGVCVREGKPTDNEDAQRELADLLRGKVVDELVKRRAETEWFIEGDFDQYAEKMREAHVWGGEPELLMLSHVLRIPITVYMTDRGGSDGLIAIAEYGQEYGKDGPVRVLYHGFGHYDALQMPGGAADGPKSKL